MIRRLRLAGALLAPALLCLLSAGCTVNLASVSSGQVGCPVEEIEVTDVNTGFGTKTWTATCHGRIFYCSAAGEGERDVQYECAPMVVESPGLPQPASSFGVNPAKADTPPAEFPKDALGFSFGMTPEQAEGLCVAQNHEWRGEADSYECDGAGVDVGLPLQAKLSFCDGALCELRALVKLSNDDAGSQRFVKLRKGLRKQYGVPDKDKTKVPLACREKLTSCLVDGQAAWEAEWTWDDGSLIRAKTGADGQSAAIGILYRKGKAPEEISKKKGEDADPIDVEAF